MPRLNSDQLKDKFTDKCRPSGSDFGDLIDTCINAGYTGDISVGSSVFSIKNGIIIDVSINGIPSIAAQSSDTTSTSTVGDTVTLKSGTVYDGAYTHEDKIFPDPTIIKVYVNAGSRNRFVSYESNDGNVYWVIVKRGWFGTVDSLTLDGLVTDIKSKPFNTFVDLKNLKGNWSLFFTETDVKPKIKGTWSIN